MPSLTLQSPLDGWCAPLSEVPDQVFAEGMIGDGMAVDPVNGILRAPCDGEIIAVPPEGHAVSIRAMPGVDVLIHVGIDSVNLHGRGFESLVRVGQRVRAGDELIRFDLDIVARGAKSLMTPVVLAPDGAWRIRRRHAPGRIRTGEMLIDIDVLSPSAADVSAWPVGELTRSLVIPLAHGLHARPAAIVAKRARDSAAHVSVSAHGKVADARSVTALMALGLKQGDEVRIVANGANAAAALDAVVAGINEAVALEKVAASEMSLSQTRTADAKPALEKSALKESPRGMREAARAGGAEGPLAGVVAVRGFVLGRIARIERTRIDVAEKGNGVAYEQAELERARKSVRARLSRVAASGGATRREIADAHLAFLDDPSLNEAAEEAINAGKSAAFAWRAAIRAAIEALSALDDERMRERADDLLDIESHVLLALAGEVRPMNLPLPPEAVVAAEDLLPSELICLDRANLRAIVLGSGGPTSHVAILAAAMDIPMLVGVGAELRNAPNGQRVIVDAEAGVLHVSPDSHELARAEQRVSDMRRQRAVEREAAQADCRTRDGTRIEVFANLGSVAEAEAAVEAGAEGCGLLRTEFLFIDRETAPGEDEQFEIYQSIATALGDRPLILRLMDVGGDKPLPYLPLPAEENPALGLRGVRTALRHPDLLRTQLRAALRVRPHVRILIPMVTDLSDVTAVRRTVDELRGELGIPVRIEIGAMIETPAAALTADRIAEHVDFFSIGSNDLTQYTLAMDRGHPDLARRVDALHPAVLKLIALVGGAGERHSKLVAVCGGIASDPAAVRFLIGLGVRELSVVPAAIGAIKRELRSLDIRECSELAVRALEVRTAADVRSLVAAAQPPDTDQPAPDEPASEQASFPRPARSPLERHGSSPAQGPRNHPARTSSPPGAEAPGGPLEDAKVSPGGVS